MSNKSRRENQNTNFMLNNFFSENRALYEIISINVVEKEVAVWQYGSAHAGLVRLHARRHTPETRM
jgi:hypothetical protein